MPAAVVGPHRGGTDRRFQQTVLFALPHLPGSIESGPPRRPRTRLDRRSACAPARQISIAISSCVDVETRSVPGHLRAALGGRLLAGSGGELPAGDGMIPERGATGKHRCTGKSGCGTGGRGNVWVRSAIASIGHGDAVRSIERNGICHALRMVVPRPVVGTLQWKRFSGRAPIRFPLRTYRVCTPKTAPTAEPSCDQCGSLIRRGPDRVCSPVAGSQRRATRGINCRRQQLLSLGGKTSNMFIIMHTSARSEQIETVCDLAGLRLDPRVRYAFPAMVFFARTPLADMEPPTRELPSVTMSPAGACASPVTSD